MTAKQILFKYCSTKIANTSIIAVICAVLVALLPLTTFATSNDAVTVDNILKSINVERTKNNLTLLEINPKLQQAAQNKAHDMVLRKYFSHKDPDGQEPWKWLTQLGYDYTYAGENLAIGFVSSKSQQLAWMKSPLHQRNILNKNYRETGIAVVRGTLREQEELIVVQLFATPTNTLPITAQKMLVKQSNATNLAQSSPLPTVTIASRELAIHTIVLWLFLLSETIIAITVAWQTIKPQQFTHKLLPHQLRAQLK